MAHPSTGPVHTLSHSVPPTLLTHASTRDFWTLTGILESVSFGVTAPFSWVLVHTRFCLFSSRISPVLCKFRRLYDGVNGVLQEGLCHTHVYCTHSPCPCSSPLLIRTSAGDTQTEFWLSLCGVSGSWCTQGLSEHLWWVWGLILNAISPLLPSCWGFSFALGSRIYFFGGILHSPVNGCSAVSCNFGVLAADKNMSFSLAILCVACP